MCNTRDDNDMATSLSLTSSGKTPTVPNMKRELRKICCATMTKCHLDKSYETLQSIKFTDEP